jgi:hypothetical protein
MADDGDKSGEGGGGAGGDGGGNYPPPMLPVPAAPGFGYPGVVLAPTGAIATPTDEIKLSDAVPAQVRAELPWLVKTAKKGRMPVGVISTCYRLLLILLDDLEQGHKPKKPKLLGTIPIDYAYATPHFRLKKLRKAGAVTQGVVEEALLLKLTPPSKNVAYGALMGDAADAQRYVAFLRMLVDVAYEARAKYRKQQVPASKTHQSTSMTVTVGPPTTS